MENPSAFRLSPSAFCLPPSAFYVLLSLILLLILPLTGCRRGGEPGTLVIAIEVAPRGFDPRFSTTFQTSARIMQLIYDTLVVKNDKFEFVPSLAERFEESDDHRDFTFHLRAGVMFHNGKQLTSADVKYTFDSLLSPALKSPIRGTVDKISSIDAPDPLTVVFHAREPFYTFIGNLPAIGIIPEGSGTEIFNSPVGSGPYKFASYKDGSDVQLEANAAYWGGAPNIPRVHIKVVTDNSTRQAELMSGDVDLAYNAQFDPETIRALGQRRDMQVILGDGASIGYLGVNVSPTSVLSNQKLRQAVAYGIDRDVIIHRLLRDQARKANAIMPPEHWAYDAAVKVYDHDPERAKQLLDEAGLPDPDGDGPRTRVTLTMLTTTTQLSRNIASIMQDQLRRVGIQLELLSLEPATLFDKLSKAQFDLYYLIGIGFNQLTDVFQFVYHSRYQDPEFNDAIAKLRATNDPAQMTPLLDQLQRKLTLQRILHGTDSVETRYDYCFNSDVARLASEAAALDSVREAGAKKQLYLRVASLLTDRGGQNRMRYCNPQVDQWIVEAERANDRPTKLDLFSRIEETVSDELPQIYLWYPANVLAARTRVGNIQIEASGSWFFITRLTLDHK
ncbi:MAG TPA: ABC transporter substrate-binding protein [Blastocatellia bacterium]|nr:ABC transporter substrate-binding protein [Blastocatellia bacterium]